MIIMSGATVLTLAEGDVAEALIPFVLGLLAPFVAYGRRSWLTTALPGLLRSSNAEQAHVTAPTSNAR